MFSSSPCVRAGFCVHSCNRQKTFRSSACQFSVTEYHKSPHFVYSLCGAASHFFIFQTMKPRGMRECSTDDAAALNTLHKATLDDQVQKNQRN